MKVYLKNSFDHFGDDLTELMLSYLTLEDKIRLECVSKQWRRLVFNKQFVIELSVNNSRNSLRKLFRRVENEIQVNEQALESVVKKCPNIRRIDIMPGIKIKVLSPIAQHFPNLKAMEFFPNSVDELTFFKQYGPQIEELVIFYDDYDDCCDFEEYMVLFPNLKKIDLETEFDTLFDDDKDFLPKLEFISNYLNIFSIENMNTIVHKYIG